MNTDNKTNDLSPRKLGEIIVKILDAKKAKDIKLQTKAYERQQAELKRLNDLIEKFKHKPSKASFARSRKSIIERMELIECPEPENASFFTGPIEPLVLGPKWVYEAEHLKIGYNKKAIKELSIRIRRGQKIGIIGANGTPPVSIITSISSVISKILFGLIATFCQIFSANT